ncbi:extracellular solute-binding protein [Microbaculum sp. A6E488]|uniref:Extracellular solute-binding protein n=2 Tax=Microbaculum marinisediminis TaxID=2931392 RepID=A0AAW5R3J2_9HYPH|nr:extracellular solute-binding protein [Microbaculum sp. A6E488]MCT8973085.1 extracellular solute-binding protein [Microbaculum sp. A6E488]
MKSKFRLLGGGVALAGLLVAGTLAGSSPALAACELQFKPEDGAELTLLRWKRFIQAEEDAFMKIVENFQKDCGITVNVQNESLDDVQPKASVAANVNQGPDMVWGLYSLPHLFPDKLVDVTDLADYLAGKYGPWVPSAVKYGTKAGTSEWIDIPIAYNGNYINYRISAVEKAGFKEPPKTTAEFMELAKALKEQGTPLGMALGHATGDGNAWVHWALWSFGGSLVNENDEVIINSPETKAAVEYVKELYGYMAPGVAAWNDSNNNKAFMSGEVSMTNNGPSIYPAAKKDAPDIAADMNHAKWPVGPVGKPTEFHIAYPMMIFKYSKYPNAAKGFIEYLFQPAQYDMWLQAAVAYLTPPLEKYEANSVFTDDPKLTVFRDAARDTLTAGYEGSVGEKAASALAEFIVLDMFANAATGNMSVDDAIAQAERQAKRIYR